MGRKVLIAAAILTLVFTAVLGVIHAPPSDVDAARAFLGGPTSACAPPCFMGIRPGETTSREAIERLRDSPWVKAVYQTEADSVITWDWSDRRPGWIDGTSPGHLVADSRRVVTYVDVQSNVPAATLWLAYGAPPRGFITSRTRQMIHFIGYPDAGLDAYVLVRCPASAHDFWSAHAYIYWGVAWRTTTSDRNYPLLWRDHLSC